MRAQVARCQLHAEPANPYRVRRRIDRLQPTKPRKENPMTTARSHAPSRPARQALHGYLYSKLASLPSAASDDIPETDEGSTPASADQDHRPRRSMPFIHRLAVHEASHAAIYLYLGLGTITEITIDAPRGGYVASRTDEFHEQTEELLTAHLAGLLAGRAGEEVITQTVGANVDGETHGSDHALATKLAYDMETAMGFGQRRPLLYRSCADWPLHLALDPELAEDVNRRLQAAYEAARKMVEKQVPAIDYLYRQLLSHGTLVGPELETALAETRKLIRE
jgi:Peptidase family M41